VEAGTGGAWLSSARAVRCWVKSRNERNPCSQLLALKGQHSARTAVVNTEEGGDDVKSSRPLCPGLHTCYNGRYRGKRSREVEQIPKNRPQFGLQAEIRLHEAGIGSNRGSASRLWWKGGVEGTFGKEGEVVTRQPYRKVRLDHLLSKEKKAGYPKLF